MTRKTFNTGLAMLLNAWTYAQEKTTVQTEEIYWHELRHVPDDKFMAGVHSCLIECHFFPVIADLVERIYPAYEHRGPYNPYGSGKLLRVSPSQQLAAAGRESAMELEAVTKVLLGGVK